MKGSTFELTLRTPSDEVYHHQVKSISFRGEGGQMQVFAHHASMTATILFSTIRIDEGDRQEEFMIRKGLFLFDNRKNTASLLALFGEKRSEISHQTAKEYLTFIEEQLKKGKDLSEFHILYLEGEKLAVEEQVKSLE